MSDNQSENSGRWNGDRANHPQIHTNRFDTTRPSAEEELRKKEQEETARRRKISDETHHISHVKDLPEKVQFIVLKDRSFRYDDGYGDRGNTSYSTMNFLDVIVFDSEAALEDWVLSNTKETFKVIRSEPVKTELKTVFTIVQK